MENTKPNFYPEVDLKDTTIIVHTDELSEPVTLVGRLIIKNRFVHVYGNKPEVATIPENKPENTKESGIISVMSESGLVRLLYEGRVLISAVTHVTDKCWRLFNTEVGWCWIPKNVLRWSPQVNMFCVVDSDYFPEFNLEDSFCNEYPSVVENPEWLINLLYEEE